jgi:hypothetical protein
VLGDALYGRESGIVPPLHLHARAVAVPLYATRPPIVVEAPPPAHMRSALHTLGWREAAGVKSKTESATVVDT